jgi:hypothetical protein
MVPMAARTNGPSVLPAQQYVTTHHLLTIHPPRLTPITQLKLNDGSKTPIARYHRQQLGIIGKPRKARIEIHEGGIHMVDAIVITFAIVEKLRRDD